MEQGSREANGVQIPSNSAYPNPYWGGVGAWEDLVTELRG